MIPATAVPVITTHSPWPDHHRFAASVTFDGGYRSAVEAALPRLADQQFPSTWFLVAGAVGGHLEGRPTVGWDEWVVHLEGARLEIGNHSLTHPIVRSSVAQRARWLVSPANWKRRVSRAVRRVPRATTPAGASDPLDPTGRTVSPPQMINDARHGQTVLAWQLGRSITSFAYPSGRAHPDVARALLQSGHIALRTTEGGCHLPGQPLDAIPARLFTINTTEEDAAGWVDAAARAGGWYVDVHHLVTPDRDYVWSTSPELFERQLHRLRDAGAWVTTVSEAALQLNGSREVTTRGRYEAGRLVLEKAGRVAVTVRAELPPDRQWHEGRQLSPEGTRLDAGVLTWAAPPGDAKLEVTL